MFSPKFKIGGVILNNRVPHPASYPGAPQNVTQRPNNRPAPKKKRTPPFVIYLELILAIVSVTVAVLLISLLPCEITFEYTDTVLPTTASVQATLLAEPNIDESEAPVVINLPAYIFSEVVPESEAVEFSYFDDTVFVGDSRTQGLLLYSKITPYDFSAQGLNVKSIQQKSYLRLPDENGELKPHTLIEALTRERGNYKSIYIATGLNELGWQCSGFINAFSELITSIREVTDVPIYIQLIIPVTIEASETSEFGITNEKCFEFNEALRKFALENELFLLDPTSLFTLEDGTLNPEYSFDGIHLSVRSCATLAEYYRTHTVNIYNYNNTIPPEAEEGITEAKEADPE